MTLTAQKVRSKTSEQKTQVSNWNKLFPNKVDTRSKSLMFVKKLLTVSLSNITYLRGMFPEDAFANRSLDKLPLKILREDSNCKEAEEVSKWLKGAFEAIEKQYLRELMFVVYDKTVDDEKSGQIGEVYTFKFSYPGDEVTCDLYQGKEQKKVEVVDHDSVKQSTQLLLRRLLLLTQNLGELPARLALDMILTYYDEKTPKDYEPEGFKAGEEIPLTSGLMDYTAGCVKTGHHELKVRVQARHNTGADSTFVSNSYSQAEVESQESCKSNEEVSPAVAKAESGADDENGALDQSNIRCSCKNTSIDLLMLTCSECSKKQHAACYRKVTEDSLSTTHLCVDCSTAEKPCTDPKMVKMRQSGGEERLALTCLYRRVIVRLSTSKQFSQSSIQDEMSLDPSLATQIVQDLIGKAVIKDDGEEKYSVDQSKLEPLFRKILGFKMLKVGSVDAIVGQTMDLGLQECKGGKRERCERNIESSMLPVVTSAGEGINALGSSNGLSIRKAKRRKISCVEEDLDM